MREKPVIALDGPAGAGKSSVAALLAKKLGYQRIETGALYRALGYRCMKDGLDPRDAEGMTQLSERVKLRLEYDASMEPPLTRVWIDGEECTQHLREESVGQAASILSQHSGVRHSLIEVQRSLGARGGVVVEGRDITTVIFPDAEFKFFITADPNVRAQRRVSELHLKGLTIDSKRVYEEMSRRDHQDATRASAPLVASADAETIDTTTMSLEEVVQYILGRVTARPYARH